MSGRARDLWTLPCNGHWCKGWACTYRHCNGPPCEELQGAVADMMQTFVIAAGALLDGGETVSHDAAVPKRGVTLKVLPQPRPPPFLPPAELPAAWPFLQHE